MTKWLCPLCDYIWDGEWPPTRCPRCGAPREKFVKIKEKLDDLLEK
jgi:rubrerythrin